MTFGQLVSRLRTDKKMSLRGLASRANVAYQYIWKIENDQAIPSVAITEALDRALDAQGTLSAALPLDERPAAGAGPRHRRGSQMSAPFELLRDTAHFVGREDEVKQAIAALTSTAGGTCLLHGMAGSGKTALAVRVAHNLAPEFADGVLFIDLHGYTPGTPAVSPHEALGRLLPRIGVSGDGIPEHLEDRAVMWRTRLRGRRMLVLLDNARSVAQVIDLLPAEPGCAVMVTSRDRLNALDDFNRIEVTPLSDESATALLRGAAGFAVDLGPPVVDLMRRVVRTLGGLPLALRIVAARRWRDVPAELDMLWQRLAHQEKGIEEIDDGTRDLSAAFATSVEALRELDQLAFTLLGLHPGADFDARAAAALAGTSVSAAEKAISRLFDANLLLQYLPTRFRFHDLVRSFARKLAPRRLSPEERALAVQRLVEHYLAAADAADRLITPHRHRPFDVTDAQTVPDLRDGAQALALLAAERDNLLRVCELASASGLHQQCWQLAFALRGYYFVTKQYDDCVSTHNLALKSAIALGDVPAQVYAHNNLGLASIERGDIDTAAEHYRMALGLANRVGDRLGAATAHANLGWATLWRGDCVGALDEFMPALTFYRRRRLRRNTAITLRGVAIAQARVGLIREARRHLQAALRTFEDLGLDVDAAMARNCLAEISCASGDTNAAIESHRRAIELASAAGSQFEVARAHLGLGDAWARLGDADGASEHFNMALEYAASVGVATIEQFRSRVFGPVNGAGRAYRGSSVPDHWSLDDAG
ncbi:MAG TPA: NB-ARC domain-containing protein [Micromonosporaceae bacterium]|jgi:tetratricopeptide (TPR) repeat protein/transcriptional regulator with XRE-family HTH domain